MYLLPIFKLRQIKVSHSTLMLSIQIDSKSLHITITTSNCPSLQTIWMEHFPNERLVHTLQYKFIFETSIGNRIFLHYCSNVNLYFKIYDDFVPKWISTNILNNNFQSFSLPFGRRFVLMFFFQESRCQLLKKHRNWVKKNILFSPPFLPGSTSISVVAEQI